MPDEPDQVIPLEVKRRLEEAASQRALERARVARWDRNVVIFLFTILVLIIILLNQGVAIEIVGSIAVFALSMVWVVGWRQGKRLYQVYYSEELSTMQQGARKSVDETIEEKIQKALRERWH